ncbi:hypothetical protein ID866_7019 [Astraeus odoratus]|nr:hypothetical protein ID866_7019 [Astraeus odoratus]
MHLPRYKRGPPKGYIQAIEQRWHQVEALLGAVLASPDPRVQELLAEIREDDLAREILDRVDTGPFGPSGRLTQAMGATKEDFVACIFRSNEGSSRDASRIRRQSRISREIVSSSSTANSLSTMPSAEWQDRLTTLLTKSTREQGKINKPAPPRTSQGGPVTQRRRLDEHVTIPSPVQVNWNEMYTLDRLSGEPTNIGHGIVANSLTYPDSDDVDESRAITAFGQLSVDENQEVHPFSESPLRKFTCSRSDTMEKQVAFICCRGVIGWINVVKGGSGCVRLPLFQFVMLMLSQETSDGPVLAIH